MADEKTPDAEDDLDDLEVDSEQAATVVGAAKKKLPGTFKPPDVT